MTASQEDNAALLSQCLDFCKSLSSKSLTFSFALTIGDSFSFSLATRGEVALASKAKKNKKTPSALRRNARRRAEFLKKKLETSTGDSTQSEHVSVKETVERVAHEKAFKCDQCENIFKSENGLKIHVGKAHKKVISTPATPDQLRQQMEGSVSLSASPLLDTSRDELSLNFDAVEEKDPTPSSRPSPSSSPPHKCPAFAPCSRKECKLRVEREKEKENLNQTCGNCDDDLYSYMCCAVEEGLCHECCSCS